MRAATVEAPIVRPFMPELDNVRGIAVLMVVGYHGLYWSASKVQGPPLGRLLLDATRPGWLGVQLFFVLSGFLITGILLDARARPDYYARFYKRRALRILPAYFALLALLIAFGVAGAPFIITSALFLSNLGSMFGVPLAYGPLWSLAVEEQFYLVWPFVVKRFSTGGVAFIATMIVVLTPAVRWFAFVNGIGWKLYMYTWFVADALAYGALLALFVRHAAVDRRRLGAISAASLIAGLVLFVAGAPFGIATRTSVFGATFQSTPWLLLFAGFIGTMLWLGSGPYGKHLNVRPLRFFARISYGLYLIHLLIFMGYDGVAARWLPSLSVNGDFTLLMLRFVICVTIATGVAWLSRETLEEFFLRRKDGRRADV